MLKKSTKYELKARAHALKPVILMGAKGLTDAVIQETDHALSANELIKIKLTGVEREEKHAVLTTMCEALHAHFIQLIGNVATLYRPKPEEKKVVVQSHGRSSRQYHANDTSGRSRSTKPRASSLSRHSTR